MENYNNEIFGFGNYTEENNDQILNFNYDSISGLGQSDYENEDLFSTEVENNTPSNFDNYYNHEPINTINEINNVGINYVENNELVNQISNETYNPFIQNFEINNNFQAGETMFAQNEVNNPVQNDTMKENLSENFVNMPPVVDSSEENDTKINFDSMIEEPIKIEEPFDNAIEQPIQSLQQEQVPVVQNVAPAFEAPIVPMASVVLENLEANEGLTAGPLVMEAPQVDLLPEIEIGEEQPLQTFQQEQPLFSEEFTEVFEPSVMSETSVATEKEEFVDEPLATEQAIVPVESENMQEKIEISDTPIEQLNKLTEYEEEKIEETDINDLFNKVSVNFKDASDIFRRNSDLKRKIDTRFEELKKLQSELENGRKKQLDEINSYKTEVLQKLTEKKEEIERRLNVLKESKATFEKERKEFEEYKKKEQDNIDRVQKEVQAAYDDRREELNHIEDVLRKQKDSLDEERSQLSLDRIQYESDKNELANNLLKFNELVNSFTNGVNDIKE